MKTKIIIDTLVYHHSGKDKQGKWVRRGSILDVNAVTVRREDGATWRLAIDDGEPKLVRLT